MYIVLVDAGVNSAGSKHYNNSCLQNAVPTIPSLWQSFDVPAVWAICCGLLLRPEQPEQYWSTHQLIRVY